MYTCRYKKFLDISTLKEIMSVLLKSGCKIKDFNYNAADIRTVPNWNTVLVLK